MKNLYNKWLWAKWRFTYGHNRSTCNYLFCKSRDRGLYYDYKRFLKSEFYCFDTDFTLTIYHKQRDPNLGIDLYPLVLKQRRELMWRFLWKGER